MNGLPRDILCLILSPLEAHHRFIARYVCRSWWKLLPKVGLISGLYLIWNMNLLSWAHNVGMPLTAQIMTEASMTYDFNIVCWLYQHGCPWSEYACSAAALCQKLDFLIEFRQNGAPWDAKTASYAAESNNVQVFRYVIENGCEWHGNALDWCFHHDNIAMLDILNKTGKLYVSDRLTAKALVECRLGSLEWIYKHDYIENINDEWYVELVTRNPKSLPSLQWLESKYPSVTSVAAIHAIHFDNIAVISYLYQKGFTFTLNHCYAALYDNSLKCIEYFMQLD